MSETAKTGQDPAVLATRRLSAAIKGERYQEPPSAASLLNQNLFMDYEAARTAFWHCCQEDGRQNGYNFSIGAENVEAFRNLVKYLIFDESGEFEPHKGLCITGEKESGKTRLLRIIQRFINATGIHQRRFRFADMEEVKSHIERSGKVLPVFLFPNINMGIDSIFTEGANVRHELEIIKIRRAMFYRDENPVTTHFITERTHDEIIDIMGVDFEALNCLVNFLEIKATKK